MERSRNQQTEIPLSFPFFRGDPSSILRHPLLYRVIPDGSEGGGAGGVGWG